jgi:hypothetical protein
LSPLFFLVFFVSFQTVLLISALFCAYLNNLRSSITNSEFQAIFPIVYHYINPFSTFFDIFWHFLIFILLHSSLIQTSATQ